MPPASESKSESAARAAEEHPKVSMKPSSAPAIGVTVAPTSADNPTSGIFHTIDVTPPVTSLNNSSRFRSIDEGEDHCSLWVISKQLGKYLIKILRPFHMVVEKFFEWVSVINLPLYLLGILFTAIQFSKVPSFLGPILLSVPSVAPKLEKGIREMLLGIIAIKKDIKEIREMLLGIIPIKEDIIDIRKELASQIEKMLGDTMTILTGLGYVEMALRTMEVNLINTKSHVECISGESVAGLKDIKEDMKEISNQIGGLSITMREIKDVRDGKDELIYLGEQLQAIRQQLTSIKNITDSREFQDHSAAG